MSLLLTCSNKIVIEFEINLTCKERVEEFYLKNLIALNQNITSYSYKIGLNEWALIFVVSICL